MQLVQDKASKQLRYDLDFPELYEDLFPKVASFLSKQGSSYDLARDIFQDAVIIYFEKVSHKKEEVDNPEAYIMGVVRHLWFRTYNENQQWVDFAGFNEEVAESVDEYLNPVQHKVMSLLERAGRKCLELLRAFYYQKASLHSIAGDFGFSGIRSATVQKYKCLKKVKDQVKKEEIDYADFFE